MGEGKRDRERPHLKPISPAETLFYYGFLAKAFFDSDKGTQEFAYIPDDLLELLKLEESIDMRKKKNRWAALQLLLKRHLRFPPQITFLMMQPPILAALRLGKSDWQVRPATHRSFNNSGIIKKRHTPGGKSKILPRSSAHRCIETPRRSMAIFTDF